jgi:hypothetical protein
MALDYPQKKTSRKESIMALQITEEATKKTPDGIIEVSIILKKEGFKKQYTYSIRSEYELGQVRKLIHCRAYGRALNLLKQNNKPFTDTEGGNKS